MFGGGCPVPCVELLPSVLICNGEVSKVHTLVFLGLVVKEVSLLLKIGNGFEE